MQDTFSVRQHILGKLKLLLVADLFHFELFVANGLLDDEPVKPGEGHIDSEVTINVLPGLHVVNFLNVLDHILHKFVIILMSLQIDGVQHGSFVVLIHSDQPFGHMGGFKFVRLIEEVR